MARGGTPGAGAAAVPVRGRKGRAIPVQRGRRGVGTCGHLDTANPSRAQPHVPDARPLLERWLSLTCIQACGWAAVPLRTPQQATTV